MQVLFVGPFRDSSGWSSNAVDQVLALDSVGVDVVVRCVKFTASPPEPLPERILELEKKDATGCDVVIQNVLPSVMERVGRAKHVAYYFAEFDSLPSDWGRKVALLDESWVPNVGVEVAERRTNMDFDRRITVVPCATDVEKFRRSYEPHAFRRELDGRFIFYTIGEGLRKNFQALVKAFHLEFRPEEPVELVIKTSVPGMSPRDAKSFLESKFLEIKQNLGLYPLEAYKREMTITERMTPEGILRLHASCDCFVSASHGEGFNLGLFDGMGFGKTPVYSTVSGHESFMSHERGYPVATTPEPVVGLNDGIHDGRQWWRNVNLTSLMSAMRKAYEERDTASRLDKARAGVLHANNFSYTKVGSIMKSALEKGGRS